MSTAPSKNLVVSIVLIAVVVVIAVVFRGPLVAWFTGKPMGGTSGTALTANAGPFTIHGALSPDPPRQQAQDLVLDVSDASGKPVDDATVDVAYDMPAMGGMSEMKGGGKVAHEKNGRYRATFDLPMGGTWTLRATIRSPAGSASQGFTMTVGTAGLALAGGGGSEAPPGSASTPGEIDHYTCSMHPSVKQNAPGTCPICGMNLIPVTKEQQEQGVVVIDEARRQLIGVRTERVVVAPIRTEIRAVGRVTYDESTLSDVTLKVRGFITRLFVNETGQKVSRGQTLLLMYSPELYNGEQDFLLATQGASSLGAGSDAGTSRVEFLGRAARQRLHLLGLDDGQIDAVAKSGKPSETVAVPSPATGFVVEKDVVEGAAVDAGMRLFRIAGLSKVWVEAEVYEADLANVHVGQPVTVTLDYLPGKSFDAKVAYIYPYLDAQARTGRVRIELANKELELRPGMYASVSLGADLGAHVLVPASAVVYTGPRRLVFVDLGEGRLRPTEVRVGAESNGMYEVLSGLSEGDVVATSGLFLIAAEARISTAAKYWESEEAADAATPMPEASRPPAPPMKARMPPIPSSGIAPAPPAASAPPPATDYTCPMDPDVHSPNPGKCPKCGMNLVPAPKAGK